MRATLAMAFAFAIFIAIPSMASDVAPGGPLPDKLACIFGEKADKAYLGRMAEVHKLSFTLRREETDAILLFLASKRVKDDVLSDLEFNAIKNELFIVLMRQKTRMDGLSLKLVEMFYAMDNDPTWRNYCIQFMGQWHPKETDASARKAMRDAICAAFKERSTAMASTALIAMYSLKGLPEGFSAAEIIDEAYSQTTDADKDFYQLGKATSLQIQAMLSDKRALPLAKDLLNAPSSSVQLKLSALCAIGMLGSMNDADLLEKYVKSTDVRLRYAAKQALKKISG